MIRLIILVAGVANAIQNVDGVLCDYDS